MFGWVNGSVGEHAERQGCLREAPLSGLCVECPVKAKCRVPRVPLVLWTCRITHSLGQAAAIFYLQDLSYSRIGDKPRILPNLGKESYRVNAMEMRCGDVVRLDGIEESGINPNRTINLLGYLQTVRGEALETCSNHVVMDSYQARYHQVSNYGRKAILAIQCCSEACAKKLADMVNHNWVTTTALIREHRPLRKLAGKTSQP